MSESERTFALLVEANPVPDPAVLPERLVDVEPSLQVVDPGRMTMQTEATVQTLSPKPRRRRGWIAALAAAIVVIAVGVAGALLLANDTETQPVVTEPPATTVAPLMTTLTPDLDPQAQARADAAVVRAEELVAAVHAGDVGAVASLTSPDELVSEADTRMWEFNGVAHAAYPPELDGCAAAGVIDAFVVVDCAVTITDPVWAAVGVTEVVVPWHVYDDGKIEWVTMRPADFHLVNLASAEYLELRHPDEYAAVCDPEAYALGSVNHDVGLALTRTCAELAMPLAEDIAAWVEAGKPQP